MNAKTVGEEFVRNVTLGRSGYVEKISDRLFERVRHLDALMCLITAVGGGEAEEDENGFRNCSEAIQIEVLNLAASLATEVHELHEQDRWAKDRPKEGGCNASQT